MKHTENNKSVSQTPRQSAGVKTPLTNPGLEEFDFESDPDQGDLEKMTTEELVAGIQASHQKADGALRSAKEHAAVALAQALRTGAYLLEVHCRVKKAGWGDWVKKHCPDLPISTAYRYKDLAAKFPHVRTGKATSLRQAYLAIGILSKAKAQDKKAVAAAKLASISPTTGPDLVARVQSMQKVYAAELERIDIANLEETVRQNLEQEVTALLTKLEEFRQRISSAGTGQKEGK